MKKVCIFTSMIYPVPAVKGGAVEGLVELLIRMNEKYKEIDLTVVSLYDEIAEKKSKKYKNTKFIYVKKSLLDKVLSKKIFIYLNKASMKFLGDSVINMPFVRKLYHLLNEDYDKYILEGGGDCYNFGYLHKKIHPQKLYVHFHGEVIGDKAIASWFGKYLTVSNYIARKLICNGYIDCNKVVVLPNCYDSEAMQKKYSKVQIRKRFGLNENDFVFVYWGRLLPEKGVYELIQAFIEVNSKNINSKLLIIGNANFGYSTRTSFDDKLLELCENKQIKDKIIFTGFIPHDEMGSILSACDVGVIPSIWDDPAPLTVFEGLSQGLPLIAGDVGGIPEIIENNKNGILVKWSSNYVNELCQSMNTLINSQYLRDELSKNAVKTIEKYNEREYYLQFVDIIEN